MTENPLTETELEKLLLTKNTIGEIVKFARKNVAYKQYDLALKMGASPTTLANIEANKLLPGSATIDRLILHLGLPESIGKHIEALKKVVAK